MIKKYAVCTVNTFCKAKRGTVINDRNIREQEGYMQEDDGRDMEIFDSMEEAEARAYAYKVDWACYYQSDIKKREVCVKEAEVVEVNVDDDGHIIDWNDCYPMSEYEFEVR